MSFLHGDDGKEKTKRRSMLGLLFNPDFGADLRPIGQSMGMFVRLIAMLFVSNGLFPKNHPAIADLKQRLTLGEVFNTAYRSLSFTKEGLPQVLLFAAVAGGIGVSFLFALFFFLSLFVGQAHAASIFTPPTCDLASIWIDHLFLGKSLTVSGCQGTGAPDSQAIQSSIKGALAFFSNGVLVIAGLMLLYHLVFMVAETAHTGKPMGKANQIWAPIRLVVAIGLLVPIGSAGLNTGQYIAVQVAKWGSGLASNGWNFFMNGMANYGNYGNMSSPPSPEATEHVFNAIKIFSCMETFNRMINHYENSLSISLSDYSINKVATIGSCGALKLCTYDTFTNNEDNLSCGSVKYATEPSTNVSNMTVSNIVYNIWLAQKTATESLFKIGGTANQIAKRSLVKLPPAYRGTSVLGMPVDDNDKNSLSDFDKQTSKQIDQLVVDYQTAINQSLSSANSFWNGSLMNVSNTTKEQGWVMAGAWFNTIARAQGAVYNGAEAPLPEINAPFLDTPTADDGFFSGLFKSKDVSGSMTSSQKISMEALKKFNDDVLIRTTIYKPSATEQGVDAGLPPESQKPQGWWGLKLLMGGINWLGASFGMWPEDDSLAFNFNSGNPLAELTSLGYKNLMFGMNIISIVGVASAASGIADLVTKFGPFKAWSPAAKAIGTVVGGLSGFAISLAAIFIGTGLLLAYYMPLIPFFKFFFNVINWLLTVFGAVISAPIFALAHVNPDGDGLPGGMAKAGYFFLLSILIRPILMVFGLFIGLLLFFIGINFLNMTFNLAVVGSGSWGGALAVMGKIVYSIIYAMTAYILANNCFRAISYFPENIMAWIGAQGAPTRDIGDSGKMFGTASAIGGYMGKELATNMVTSSKVFGEARSAYLEKKKSNEKDKYERKDLDNAGGHDVRMESKITSIEKNLSDMVSGGGYPGSPTPLSGDKSGNSRSNTDNSQHYPRVPEKREMSSAQRIAKDPRYAPRDGSLIHTKAEEPQEITSERQAKEQLGMKNREEESKKSNDMLGKTGVKNQDKIAQQSQIGGGEV